MPTTAVPGGEDSSFVIRICFVILVSSFGFLRFMNTGLALLEIHGLTPALVALDRLEKAARVRLVQMELNDFYGVFLKIAGDSASLRAAVEEARTTIEQMQGKLTATIIDSPTDQSQTAIHSRPEVSPLLEAPVVFDPNPGLPSRPKNSQLGTDTMNEHYAIGLIETQGFTAVMAAIDTACKAANVEVIGKEKLGGGYITVMVKGDVAAVKAAIEAGQQRVEGLGKLIAAHIIARPSSGVLSLLPK
jgi:microcompartment protein CcmL/EutN